MAVARRFEELVAWQAARRLAAMVFRITRRLEQSREYVMMNQLRRAAISVPANVAEGFESGSDAEFRRFLGYARRSTGEIRALTYVAQDAGLLSEGDVAELRAAAEEAGRIINGLIACLSRCLA